MGNKTQPDTCQCPAVRVVNLIYQLALKSFK